MVSRMPAVELDATAHGHMLAQVAEEFLGAGYEVHTGVDNICFDARKFSERIVLMLGVFLGVVRVAGV